MTVAQGSLLALVGAATPVGYNARGGFMMVDFGGDRCFQYETGPLTGAAGIKQFAIGTAGNETGQVLGTTLGHTLIAWVPAYHPMGQILCIVDGGNSSPVAKIDAAALTLTEIIGVSSGSLSLSTCNGAGVVTRVTTAEQIQPLQRYNGSSLTSFYATSSVSSAGYNKEVDIVNVTTTGTPLLLSAAYVTEESCTVGPGPNGGTRTTAVFYVIGHVYNFASGDPSPVSLYKYSITADSTTAAQVYSLPNSAVARATLRTIAPADVDSSWTNFTNVSAPGWDQNDDNIVIAFQTQDAVVNQNYLCKLNGSTGAFIWKTPVPQQIAAFIAPDKSNINRYYATFVRPLSGVNTSVWLWDLSTGVYTTQLWNRGFDAFTQQIYDVGTHSISAGMGYQVGVGPVPAYLGSYLPANGDIIPSYRFGRIFLGSPTVPPSVIPYAPYGYTRIWGNFP